jgi:hypothetical protein
MRMIRHFTIAAVLLPLTLRMALGQQPKSPPSAADSAAYATLLTRVLAGDTTADFTAFRLLAMKLAPSSSQGPTPGEQFARAIAAPDSMSARAHVDSVLAIYGGHIQAHIDAQHLYEKRGDSTRAALESAIVRAFIASIGANGGLTPETAMPVTNLAEEYAFLAAHGVRRETQALISCGDARCDALTGPDPESGASVTYYFRLLW